MMFWLRSATSHTGPPPTVRQQEAGEVSASDQAHLMPESSLAFRGASTDVRPVPAFPVQRRGPPALHATNSGVFSDHTMTCAIAELGVVRVMFSVDWPFASNTAGTDWLRCAPLKDRDRAQISS